MDQETGIRSGDILEDLAEVVNDTYKRKGVLIIPAFAVGRVQTFMHHLWTLKKDKEFRTYRYF